MLNKTKKKGVGKEREGYMSVTKTRNVLILLVGSKL